jgi:hypothetical protein
MGSEKFCLRWNDFENNISCAFRELRDDKDFFDVTLACDDEQIQAHKVIISACSPFFRNILRRNPHQHPLLYLKGVKYTDLQSVLNFMYHGEVNVAQEELNSFLAVAENLKVKGLTQNQSCPPKGTKAEQYSAPKPVPQARNSHYQAPKYTTPPSKQSQPPTPSYTQPQEYDDIQEIVPIKPEPADPLPPLPQPTSIITPEPQHYDPDSQAQAIAPADDQTLAYQESYEDYGQYQEEQEQYAGDAGANKGNIGPSVCVRHRRLSDTMVPL